MTTRSTRIENRAAVVERKHPAPTARAGTLADSVRT